MALSPTIERTLTHEKLPNCTELGCQKIMNGSVSM